MITHQMEVVQKICRRIVVMSEGKVVEEGTVKQVFERPRHEVTKRFVQTVGAGNLDKIRSELKKLYPYGQILRLTFTGEISNRPILAEVIRKVDIPVSIVNSNITTGPVGPMGVIYSHISDGTPAQYREFTDLLEAEGVKVEVL